MATIRKVLNRAFIFAGIITKNDTLSSSEAEDGLQALNAMLSSFSNESMLLTARTTETFILTGGKATYTVGAGQDFDTGRPISIVAAYVRQGITDFPLELISDVNYMNVQNKSITGLPSSILYDGGYPIGRITLHLTPSEGYALTLLTEKPLTALGLDDEFEFPAGWEEMVLYNLAVRLSIEYGVELPSGTATLARESKGNVKSAIAKNRPMKASVGTVQNIFTGYN